MGVWARGASEKIWDPLFISATVEASKRLGPKLAGAWARGASGKIWDPIFISATDLKKWYTTGLLCQTQGLGPN